MLNGLEMLPTKLATLEFIRGEITEKTQQPKYAIKEPEQRRGIEQLTLGKQEGHKLGKPIDSISRVASCVLAQIQSMIYKLH